MIQLSFRKSVLLILLVSCGSICEGQNTPCPICKDGSVVTNPDTIVQIPAGYVDIDQATCNQIQTVSASGALTDIMCSILNSGVFKADCLCSEPVASIPTDAPTIPPFAFPTNSPTQNPISFPTNAPIYVYQVPAPVALSAESTSPNAPTPVAYQTLAPKVADYQSSTSQKPAPTIKYQTLAPRWYTYRAPTAEPESNAEQGSTPLKPVAYQTLAPRSNTFGEEAVTPKAPTPVAYQTLAPKVDDYQSSTSQKPAPTIKYQTLAPRSYTYIAPTAEQGSTPLKPVAYQTLTPRSNTLGEEAVSPKAPTPVAYQMLAPKVADYQSSTSQKPAPTIKYQTLAPRSYTYRAPTVEPESYAEQGSTSLKPVVYQTLAPLSNTYPATYMDNKTNAPVPEIQQYPTTYQTLAPRSNASKAPVLSPQTSAPKQTNLPSSAPVVVPAPIPLPISVSTNRPTPIIEFDYKSCSICGADQRVANRTKIITNPPGYFIEKSSCYQLERVGLIGLMNSINCRLATLLIGEPKCGCIAKEKSPDKPPPIPANATVCYVCGKGYVVGKPSNRIQRKLGFFVGSASCGQVAEIGLIGLIPTGLCSLTKQDVKSNCGCVRVTNAPTGLGSDYPSAVPSYEPSPPPTSEKERGKEADDDEPKHDGDDEPKQDDDDDEPKHDDDDKPKYEQKPKL